MFCHELDLASFFLGRSSDAWSLRTYQFGLPSSDSRRRHQIPGFFLVLLLLEALGTAKAPAQGPQHTHAIEAHQPGRHSRRRHSYGCPATLESDQWNGGSQLRYHERFSHLFLSLRGTCPVTVVHFFLRVSSHGLP